MAGCRGLECAHPEDILQNSSNEYFDIDSQDESISSPSEDNDFREQCDNSGENTSSSQSSRSMSEIHRLRCK
jgi:hypothetical protein